MSRSAKLPLVVAHTDCDLYHSSYVMTGLFELAADGLIDLKFRLPHSVFNHHRGRFTVRLDISDRSGGDVHRICIDLHDLNNYFCHDSLRDCELYLKRSYNRAEIGKLPAEWAVKILPFGPNFGCLGASEHGLRRRWAGSVLSHLQRTGGWNSLAKKKTLYSLFDFGFQSSYKALRPLHEYESSYRNDEVKPRVYFNTRLFPEESEQVAAMNRQRIELVRRLRAELGERYLGGLITGEMVPADCISDVGNDRKTHVENVKSSLVCLYSNGLGDSVAWKLGEYMASAKCIVGEPLQNELAAPLIGGVDIFYYASTDECVAHCLRLVNDPELSREVRKRIANYYSSYVRPDRNLWRVISRVVAAPALAEFQGMALA